MNQIYTVHKTFLDGALKGLTITEKTTVSFQLGKTYGGGWTGPTYKVTAITPEPSLQPPTPPAPHQASTILHTTI